METQLDKITIARILVVDDNHAMRKTIALGLLVSCLVALRLYKSDEVRIYNEFTHKIDTYVASVDEQVTESIAILHSLKALFDASEKVTRAEFHRFARFLLTRYPSMRAVGWIPRVAADQRHDLEARAQQDGFDWFQITERHEQGEMIKAGERFEYYPIYFIEPLEGNRAALGFDLASSSTHRASLLASRDTGKAHSTGRITLVQETANKWATLFLFQSMMEPQQR